MLTQDSVGLCLAADQAPQGTVLDSIDPGAGVGAVGRKEQGSNSRLP